MLSLLVAPTGWSLVAGFDCVVVVVDATARGTLGLVGHVRRPRFRVDERTHPS